MRIDFYVGKDDANKFASSCEAAIRNVGNATKYGTEQACKEIMAQSLSEVPVDTGTLASTAFYNVQRRMATKRYTYEATLGYAGMTGSGSSYDKVNPKTGKPASSYSATVHEDLEAIHHNGKAKFLEDPVRDYGANNFKRVAETHWRYAIKQSSYGGQSYIPVKE